MTRTKIDIENQVENGINYNEPFEVLAQIYPHEVYKSHPSKFWNYFHAKFPKISKEKMLEFLEKQYYK
jgi:hypothetical protein